MATTERPPDVSGAPPPPGRRWYLFSILVFLAGFAGMGIVLVWQLSTIGVGLEQVVVPGEAQLSLSRGAYTIYHERRSVVGSRLYESTSLGSLELSVTNPSGTDVPLRPVTSSSNYQFGGREGHAAFNFTADKAGDYTVAGRYPRGENGVETVIAVGKSFVESLVGTILGALGLAFGGAGLAIYLFLRTLIRRRRAGFSF